MKVDRFYTPEALSSFMVSLIPDELVPVTAIDICCGSWNLLKAARNRWPNIKMTGIDTNKELRKHALNKRSFYCMDGRRFALDSVKNNRQYSLVIANPPFGKEPLHATTPFNELPGFSKMNIHALQRIETTMILANLALLSQNGVLCIVVPSTLINGDWATCLRAYISNNFSIKKIVNLPSNVFGRDISTTILVIENRKSKSSFIPVYNTKEKKNQTYKINFLYKITQLEAKSGRWDYSISPHNKNNDFNVKRGLVENNKLSNSGIIPVIHSTDVEHMNNPNWKPTRYLPEDTALSELLPYSSQGDIIMIRVGRNAGYATLYTGSEKMLVSDCIYVIKSNEQKVLNNIWEVVNSSKYLDDLYSIRKGVAAKYITVESLRNYLNYKLDQKGGNLNDYNSARSEGTG